ncbi:MAG: hypothetical protein GQ579_00900 [Bacteroidales bacterium]|nr:hypothetical protein [Bacteroidales bacterium]
MSADINRTNRVGGVVSLITLALCILIFAFRLGGYPEIESFLGILFLLCGVPFLYLLFLARTHQRPTIFYIQISAILLFILMELFLDYVFKIDFRNILWLTISYVIFFFAGTGGLIGIASLAGKRWGTVAIVLFLIMTFLAFWQRAKTGM